jgi:hypothetical protein
MVQLKRDLQMMQEDMQTLGKMNQVLFNSWQDQMSQNFEKGCVGEMIRKWKEYVQAVEPLVRQLSDIEKRMEALREQSKRR